MKLFLTVTALKTEYSYVTTLVGGDCLSVIHARGAQYVRRTSELAVHRLDGFLPAEDWHAKLSFGGIIIIIISLDRQQQFCILLTSFITGILEEVV